MDITAQKRDYFRTVAEPCESGLFSIYVDASARVFPCSFTEDTVASIDMLAEKDFGAVWGHPVMEDWRDVLLHNNRACPVYNID